MTINHPGVYHSQLYLLCLDVWPSLTFSFRRYFGIVISHFQVAIYTARRDEMVDVVQATLFYMNPDGPIPVHSPYSALPYQVSFLFQFLCLILIFSFLKHRDLVSVIFPSASYTKTCPRSSFSTSFRSRIRTSWLGPVGSIDTMPLCMSRIRAFKFRILSCHKDLLFLPRILRTLLLRIKHFREIEFLSDRTVCSKMND